MWALLQAEKAAAAAGYGGGRHVGEDAGHALHSSNGDVASGEHAGPETFWDRKSWPDKSHEGAGPAI